MADAPEIILDLSRLLSRIRHRTPTGVDRVELAYARELLRLMPDRLAFGAVHPLGAYGRLPRPLVETFLRQTARQWEEGGALNPDRLARGGALLETLLKMRPRAVPMTGRPRILLQSSPHHLHNEGLVRGVLRRERARFVCLLHDLIPIEYPEYARPGGAALHRRRIETVARLAAAVLTNSEATRRSFLPHLAAAGRDVPVAVAHLGLDQLADLPPRAEDGRPYFICLGTIEPRKNHLLLLHLWRDMAVRMGREAVPRLVLVGRRGWENEQVVDLLERCPALVGCVEEHSGLRDVDVQRLIAGARALLLPSFAEGYGMPVPEALALGVPVLCSDLPALREAGGDAAHHLDPLDGPAWREAILALATEDEAARAARRARLAGWQAPTWAEHFAIVTALLENVAAQ